MSGCVHCIYTIYADELETYSTALQSARAALTSAGVKKAGWPEEVRGIDDGSGGGMVERERRKVEDGLDPSMAAFLA